MTWDTAMYMDTLYVPSSKLYFVPHLWHGIQLCTWMHCTYPVPSCTSFLTYKHKVQLCTDTMYIPSSKLYFVPHLQVWYKVQHGIQLCTRTHCTYPVPSSSSHTNIRYNYVQTHCTYLVSSCTSFLTYKHKVQLCTCTDTQYIPSSKLCIYSAPHI